MCLVLPLPPSPSPAQIGRVSLPAPCYRARVSRGEGLTWAVRRAPLQARAGLAGLDATSPGACGGRARGGDGVAREVRAGLAETDLAVGVGLAAARGGGLPLEQARALVEDAGAGAEAPGAPPETPAAAAERALQRAAAALEAEPEWAPRAAGAHLHLAALLERDGAAADAAGAARGGADAAGARGARARRRLATRHLGRAAALAGSLADAARVRCVQAELAQRRGGIHELTSALDALLALPDGAGRAGAQRPDGAGRADGAGALERLSPFDGGWAGGALERCLGDVPPADGRAPDDAVWAAAQRQAQALLRCLVKSHAAQNNAVRPPAL